MVKFRGMRALWLVALLPVLLLRAAVPAGFMAASVDGALQIVLCQPGMMGTPGMAAGAAHHHHHLHAGQGSTSMPAEVDPTCPYAQSTGPALMPSLPVLPVVAAMHRLEARPAMSQTQLKFGPPRQQSPRGPPLIA